MQQASTSVHRVEDMEFGRRLAVERELEIRGPDGRIPAMWTNAVWDESGTFVLYPTLLGIKGRERYLLGRLVTDILQFLSGQHSNEPCCATTRKG
jgi:hypothetical protein